MHAIGSYKLQRCISNKTNPAKGYVWYKNTAYTNELDTRDAVPDYLLPLYSSGMPASFHSIQMSLM